jgi:hypothetical protein
MADTIKYDTELTLEHTRNARHYCPKGGIAKFLSQPALFKFRNSFQQIEWKLEHRRLKDYINLAIIDVKN